MARVERGAPVTAERGGGRGRRDPALRQRIAQDRPVYDDDTPDGEVRVRGPEAVEDVPVEGPVGQSINLDELTDEEYANLVERGLINDGDSGEIDIDLGELTQFEDEQLDEYQLLGEGDIVYARVHHPVRFDDDPSNFTYGVASRVKPGESEDEAFERVAVIVNTRALNLAQAAMGPVMRFKDDVAAERKRLMDGRSGLRPRSSRESE